MKISQKKAVAFFLFVGSLIVYLVAPKKYNNYYNIFCTIYYIISVFLYYKLNPRKNYFDFDFLFIITYFFVMFFYPTFIHPFGTSLFAFAFPFRTDLINEATGLSLMGICAYFFGGSSYLKKKISKNFYPPKLIPSDLIFYISFLSFLGFIVSGGYRNLYNLYSGGPRSGGIGSYFMILMTCGIMCQIIIWMRNLKVAQQYPLITYKIPSKESIFVGLVTGLILLTGSRTVPLQIILISIGLYSCLFYSLSLKKVIFITFLGIMGLFGVVFMRTGGALGLTSISDLFMDLIINNRNTFVALEYVDQNGISWGRSMLALLCSPMPFLQNIVVGMFNLDPRSLISSQIITTETLGSESNLGLGNTIIADIYMAYGSIGVIVLMYLLGYLCKYLLVNASRNTYALAAYGILMSYSVYMVRAELLYPIRLIIWTIVYLNLVSLHPITLKKIKLL